MGVFSDFMQKIRGAPPSLDALEKLADSLAPTQSEVFNGLSVQITAVSIGVGEPRNPEVLAEVPSRVQAELANLNLEALRAADMTDLKKEFVSASNATGAAKTSETQIV
jgi:hypothetical protein